MTGSVRWWLLWAFFLAGCEPSPRDPAVARVDEGVILPSTVSQELHGLLWRRGESWSEMSAELRQQRRQQALERCIERVLIDQFATSSPGNLSAADEKEAEHDFQQFLKQFEATDGWEKRAQLQGLDKEKVRAMITQEQVRTRALEDWLKKERSKEATTQEEQARKWFEQHRAELRRPAAARISHLFLTAHDPEKPDRSAEIAELYRKLTSGESSFETLAGKYSEDSRSKKVGGSLGWVDQDRIPADLAEQVFKLPLGKVSMPFSTALGWHVVIVHERKAARLPEFAEVRQQIMARLDQPWREAAIQRLLTELRAKAKIQINEIALTEVE